MRLEGSSEGESEGQDRHLAEYYTMSQDDFALFNDFEVGSKPDKIDNKYDWRLFLQTVFARRRECEVEPWCERVIIIGPRVLALPPDFYGLSHAIILEKPRGREDEYQVEKVSPTYGMFADKASTPSVVDYRWKRDTWQHGGANKQFPVPRSGYAANAVKKTIDDGTGTVDTRKSAYMSYPIELYIKTGKNIGTDPVEKEMQTLVEKLDAKLKEYGSEA